MRKLITILLGLLLLTTAVPTASVFAGVERSAEPTVVSLAAEEGGPCLGGDSTQFHMYENVIGQTGGGNDIKHFCGSTGTLGNHNVAGSCNGLTFNQQTWNDCASSFWAVIGPGLWLCFYELNSYTGPLLWSAFNPSNINSLILQRANFPSNANNHINSARFTSAGC